MLKKLVHDKINEVFLEYQKANNIVSGDIKPYDAVLLDDLEDSIAILIDRVCAYQMKSIDFNGLAPSWYIYTDAEGIAHSETFGQITEDQFFTKVSRRIAFDDLYDETVQKIYYKGKEVFYVGWQPCMKYEFVEANGDTVWVGYFEHWDH